jgi:hypothetical protein
MVKEEEENLELLHYNYKHLTLLLLLVVFILNCPVISFDIDELGHYSYSSIFRNSALHKSWLPTNLTFCIQLILSGMGKVK